MAATSGDKKIGKEKQTKQKNLNGEITAQLNRSYKKEIIMYNLCFPLGPHKDLGSA